MNLITRSLKLWVVLVDLPKDFRSSDLEERTQRLNRPNPDVGVSNAPGVKLVTESVECILNILRLRRDKCTVLRTRNDTFPLGTDQ